ncbi:MAG TPA: hypothetical protein ENK77_04745 [Epsilonproteobacteria bacterium]|nr:hypothetical protein [Campylobacterota bacterium]
MDSVWYGGERRSCMLKVSGIARQYIERETDTHIEIIQKHHDHDRIKFYYHNEIELFSFVKSWIPYIRIIENDPLSNKLDEELKRFLAE